MKEIKIIEANDDIQRQLIRKAKEQAFKVTNDNRIFYTYGTEKIEDVIATYDFEPDKISIWFNYINKSTAIVKINLEKE
jgi:hypothetical protein